MATIEKEKVIRFQRQVSSLDIYLPYNLWKLS